MAPSSAAYRFRSRGLGADEHKIETRFPRGGSAFRNMQSLCRDLHFPEQARPFDPFFRDGSFRLPARDKQRRFPGLVQGGRKADPHGAASDQHHFHLSVFLSAAPSARAVIPRNSGPAPAPKGGSVYHALYSICPPPSRRFAPLKIASFQAFERAAGWLNFFIKWLTERLAL